MITSYSALQLLNAIRNRGPIPENDVRFNQEKIFLLINEEMRNTVFPMMLALNEEYFLNTERVNINDHENNGFFPLPRRAYARTLRELRFIDTGNNVYNIPRINLNDGYFYPDNNPSFIATRTPFGAYFYNDSIKILGNVRYMDGELEMTYVLRPPSIALPDSNGNVLGWSVNTIQNFETTIQSVDASADTLSVSNASSFVAGFSAQVSSDGTLPGGLVANTNYFVINPTSTTIQLSETLNGSPVDLTSSGTGTITISVFHTVSSTAGEPVVRFLANSSAYSDFSLQDTVGDNYKLFDIIRISTGAVLASSVPLRVTNANSTPVFVDVLNKLDVESFNNTQSPYTDPEVYIMPAEQTGYVTLPLEAQELLVIAVCKRFYEALGYTDDYAVADKEMARIQNQLQSIYAERLAGEPNVVTNRRGLGTFMLFGKRGLGLRRRLVL